MRLNVESVLHGNEGGKNMDAETEKPSIRFPKRETCPQYFFTIYEVGVQKHPKPPFHGGILFVDTCSMGVNIGTISQQGAL